MPTPKRCCCVLAPHGGRALFAFERPQHPRRRRPEAAVGGRLNRLKRLNHAGYRAGPYHGMYEPLQDAGLYAARPRRVSLALPSPPPPPYPSHCLRRSLRSLGEQRRAPVPRERRLRLGRGKGGGVRGLDESEQPCEDRTLPRSHSAAASAGGAELGHLCGPRPHQHASTASCARPRPSARGTAPRSAPCLAAPRAAPHSARHRARQRTAPHMAPHHNTPHAASYCAAPHAPLHCTAPHAPPRRTAPRAAPHCTAHGTAP